MPKGLQTVPEPPSTDVEALVPVEPRPYGTFNTVYEAASRIYKPEEQLE